MSEKNVRVLRNMGKVVSNQWSVKKVLSFQSSVVSKCRWSFCVLVRLARASGAGLQLAADRKNEIRLLGVWNSPAGPQHEVRSLKAAAQGRRRSAKN